MILGQFGIFGLAECGRGLSGQWLLMTGLKAALPLFSPYSAKVLRIRLDGA